MFLICLVPHLCVGPTKNWPTPTSCPVTPRRSQEESHHESKTHIPLSELVRSLRILQAKQHEKNNTFLLATYYRCTPFLTWTSPLFTAHLQHPTVHRVNRTARAVRQPPPGSARALRGWKEAHQNLGAVGVGRRREDERGRTRDGMVVRFGARVIKRQWQWSLIRHNYTTIPGPCKGCPMEAYMMFLIVSVFSSFLMWAPSLLLVSATLSLAQNRCHRGHRAPSRRCRPRRRNAAKRLRRIPEMP